MTNKRIHLICSILLSVALVVAGICLISACVDIYLSGDRAFTPETVSIAFSKISIPVYLCLALVVLGFILDIFFPAEKKKAQPEKQYQAILTRLHSKLDMNICDAGIRQQIARQQNSRKLHGFISLFLLLLGSILFLSYGADSRNFDQQDIPGSMIKAMYWFIPCLAVPFIYSVFAAYHRRSSLQKEIELVKQAIPTAPADENKEDVVVDHAKLFLGLRLALLVLFVGIMVYGFFTGGTNDVLTKAINICTECVGLG